LTIDHVSVWQGTQDLHQFIPESLIQKSIGFVKNEGC